MLPFFTLSGQGLLQDKRNDAATAQQCDFQLRFDSCRHLVGFNACICPRDLYIDPATRREFIGRRAHFYLIIRLDVQLGWADACRPPKRQDAHADQVGPVNSFKAYRQHGANSKQALALRRPVAGRTRAVPFACDEHDSIALRSILRGDFVTNDLL